MALLLALVLHTPTLPSLSGVLGAFIPELEPADDEPQQELILPIELDLEGKDDRPTGEGMEKTQAPEEDDPPEENAPPAPKAAAPEPEPEVETPEPEVETPEPEPPPPEPEPVPPPEPEGDPLPAPPPLPRGKLSDPFSAAGDVSRIRAATPNVNIYLAGDVLRRRKLSKQFGTLLSSIPQWADLLGGTNLDPMRDFDHVLLSGPQMRNPKWLVATVHFNCTAKKVKVAMDQVIARSEGGGWLEGYDGLLVAAIGTKKMRRYAVLLPKRRLLVVLPEGAKKQIQLVAKLPRFEKSGKAGIILDVVNPKKAFKTLGFDIPKSLSRMRLHFSPVAGGYDVRIEGWEKDARGARATAAHLQKEFKPKGFLGSLNKKGAIARIIGGIQFRAKKNHVLGRFTVSEDKLSLVLEFAGSLVAEQKKALAKKKHDQSRGRHELPGGGGKHAPPPKHIRPPAKPASGGTNGGKTPADKGGNPPKSAGTGAGSTPGPSSGGSGSVLPPASPTGPPPKGPVPANP